ncbi:hypothetical protein LACDD01_01804 [Lactococcus sp. DD01]|nr:hypothetical protein LACDD01_01804 [Lactococcus sp. DD01]
MNGTGDRIKLSLPYLRYALMKAIKCVYQNSSYFKKYLASKQSQDKHYSVDVSYVANKQPIHIIF